MLDDDADELTSIVLDHPVALSRSLRLLAHGRSDPTTRITADGVWRAIRTPAGPVTARLRVARDDRCRVDVAMWGPGREWLSPRLRGLVGGLDSLAGFDPSLHPVVAGLAHANPNLRLPRTDRVLDALVPTILEQKVKGIEAKRSYAGLVRLAGEPAPGPAGLLLAPSPRALTSVASFEWHRLGVGRRRAETVRRAARVAHRLEEAVELGAGALRQRLLSLAGIGEWTVAEVSLVALGDGDAVSVGDYHLPNLVAWTLAGEPRGTDVRMLELLAPWPGHRGRVVRLLETAGHHAPRYGPRLALRDIASH